MKNKQIQTVRGETVEKRFFEQFGQEDIFPVVYDRLLEFCKNETRKENISSKKVLVRIGVKPNGGLHQEYQVG